MEIWSGFVAKFITKFNILIIQNEMCSSVVELISVNATMGGTN